MDSSDMALAVLAAITLGFCAYGFYLYRQAKASDRRIEHLEAMLEAQKRARPASPAE